MSRGAQVGAVIAGYGAAIAAGMVAARIYNARVAALPYDTSGGMYAGGEALSALGAFLVVSLLPTLLALWFLRRHHKLWNGVAVASVAFAGVGLLAVLMPLLIRSPTGYLAILGLLGLLQLLGMPLWFVGFVLLAFLAPTREARRKLIVALGIELVIGVCALVHWFVPGSPL